MTSEAQGRPALPALPASPASPSLQSPLSASPAPPVESVYVGLAPGSPTTEPRATGLLRLARRGNVESAEFAYGRRYLQDTGAIALNPEVLPLQAQPFVMAERRLRDGGALPLTFRDALPDTWGRKVLERETGRPLSDVEALLSTNDDRVGAMVFAKALPFVAEARQTGHVDIEALADAARRLDHDLAITPALRRLLLQGGSLGGARPKATLFVDGQRWMAKFPARGDDVPVEIVEASTLALAAVCGIDIAPFRLQPIRRGHALLVQRFDRVGVRADERRLHYLSASALLDAPYESSDGSYVELARILRKLSWKPGHDLQQLFRRMVFNLAVDNSDDHVKNHGMLCSGPQRWWLSPAFDLVMQMTHIGYQQLAILPGRMESHLDLARKAAPHFGLSPRNADALIDDICGIVATQAWLTFKSFGADAALLARVRTTLEKQYQLIGAA